MQYGKPGIPDGALPQIHISGCPSSCGTHQNWCHRFRGGVKMVDKKPLPAFVLYVNGNEFQGGETWAGRPEPILEDQIPAFLVELGKTVAASGMTYEQWAAKDPAAIDAVAAPYIQ